MPGRVAATGASRHLLQRLERALGGARIAARQAEVAIDDADQRELRKVVALGHKLRADDDVEGAARDLFQLLFQAFGSAGKIRRENEDALVGKTLGGFVREALDAGPAGDERIRRAAFGARVGSPLDVAAMVAHERAAEAMLHQPRAAIGALKAMAAALAQGERRVAAAVEKQQRLFAALQRLLDHRAKARRNPFAARRSRLLHVDGVQVRQFAPAIAIGQQQAAIAALFGVDARLDGGRGGGEYRGAVFEPRAHHRHVARIVGDAVLLLVGAFVFLIDDDEPQLLEGQEQRRARARDDLHLAARHAGPDARALARRHARMPFGRAHAEALGEAVEKLARERDFRHQDQRLPAVLDGCRDGLEIDLRLARAGDAFQQRAGIGRFVNARAQFARGFRLVGLEGGRR